MPSAVLALLLKAFFLSRDRKPLRAVYGDEDLSGHQAWVDILKAGGDVVLNAGQLGKTLTLAANLTALAGQGMVSGARRIAAATSPWILIAVGLGAAWWYSNRPPGTRQQVTSVAKSVLAGAVSAVAVYQEVQGRFTSAAPKTPGWQSLASDLSPGAVLGRACLHTLARSPGSDRSAAELTAELPRLSVAQGEAKVIETAEELDIVQHAAPGSAHLGKPLDKAATGDLGDLARGPPSRLRGRRRDSPRRRRHIRHYPTSLARRAPG